MYVWDSCMHGINHTAPPSSNEIAGSVVDRVRQIDCQSIVIMHKSILYVFVKFKNTESTTFVLQIQINIQLKYLHKLCFSHKKFYFNLLQLLCT